MKAHSVVDAISGLGELEFRTLESFNQGSVGVFWVSGGSSGRSASPWEMHPDDDEPLHGIEGEVDIEVLTEDTSVVTRVSAGSLFVVPRGHWHRHVHAAPILKDLYVTPGRSEHSSAPNPRRR